MPWPSLQWPHSRSPFVPERSAEIPVYTVDVGPRRAAAGAISTGPLGFGVTGFYGGMPSRGEVESVRGGGTVTFDFQVDPGLLNGADIVLSVSGIVNTLAASGPPPSGAVVATSSDVQLRGAGGVPIYARHLASGASIAGPLADSFVDSFSFIGLPGTTYVLTIQADSTALQLSTWAEAASASTFAALSAVARAPTPPPDGGSGGVAVPAPAGLPVLALALTALSGCRRRLRAG